MTHAPSLHSANVPHLTRSTAYRRALASEAAMRIVGRIDCRSESESSSRAGIRAQNKRLPRRSPRAPPGSRKASGRHARGIRNCGDNLKDSSSEDGECAFDIKYDQSTFSSTFRVWHVLV